MRESRENMSQLQEIGGVYVRGRGLCMVDSDVGAKELFSKGSLMIVNHLFSFICEPGLKLIAYVFAVSWHMHILVFLVPIHIFVSCQHVHFLNAL